MWLHRLWCLSPFLSMPLKSTLAGPDFGFRFGLAQPKKPVRGSEFHRDHCSLFSRHFLRGKKIRSSAAMELPRPPTCPKPQKMRPSSSARSTATANILDLKHLSTVQSNIPDSGTQAGAEAGESQDARPLKKVRFQLAEDQKKDFMELKPCKEFSVAQILGCFFAFLFF